MSPDQALRAASLFERLGEFEKRIAGAFYQGYLGKRHFRRAAEAFDAEFRLFSRQAVDFLARCGFKAPSHALITPMEFNVHETCASVCAYHGMTPCRLELANRSPSLDLGRLRDSSETIDAPLLKTAYLRYLTRDPEALAALHEHFGCSEMDRLSLLSDYELRRMLDPCLAPEPRKCSEAESCAAELAQSAIETLAKAGVFDFCFEARSADDLRIRKHARAQYSISAAYSDSDFESGGGWLGDYPVLRDPELNPAEFCLQIAEFYGRELSYGVPSAPEAIAFLERFEIAGGIRAPGPAKPSLRV